MKFLQVQRSNRKPEHGIRYVPQQRVLQTPGALHCFQRAGGCREGLTGVLGFYRVCASLWVLGEESLPENRGIVDPGGTADKEKGAVKDMLLYVWIIH